MHSGLCRQVVSVRLSVRLSRSCIMSKRLNVILSFVLLLLVPPFEFYQTLWQYSDTDPQRDRTMQGKHTNRAIFTNIRHYLRNDARWRYSYNGTVVQAEATNQSNRKWQISISHNSEIGAH